MRVGQLRFGHAPVLGQVRRCWRRVGLRSMVAGMAAFVLVFIDEGMPATPSDPGSLGGRLIVSVFGTIYSETGEYRAPGRSHTAGVRLASLETDFAMHTASAAGERTAATAVTEADRDFFDQRFKASFGERFSSFEERFGAMTQGDPEQTPRSIQRPSTLPAAELSRDGLTPLETPKRGNARLAMLPPAANTAAVSGQSAGAAPDKRDVMPALGSRTAIYDISARVVYLPNGEKVEAHSGLGEHMDDPRSVGVKNRGATPPNVYELSLREQLFHGVRAIRLTPVHPDKMFGREGILAHSYLLGPNGQSNGCVSFSDYPKFLNAFLKGEVDRLVVVERLADAPAANSGISWLSERLKALFRSS